MLALRWPMLAPCWPILGPMLRLCWRYVRPSLLKDFQDANFSSFFLPGPLRRRTKNHVKTTVFYFRQQKKSDRPRLRNTVKNNVFVTSHAHTRNTVNYRSFGRHGMNRGWVGGGAGSAYKLRCNGLRGRRQDWPRWAKHMLRDQSQTGNPQRQQWVQGFGTQEPQHAHMMP